jgi:phage I-like protein
VTTKKKPGDMLWRLQAKKTIIDESKEAVERPVTASRENVAVLSAEGNDMEMGREIR